MTFPDALKQAREAAGLTQTELGKALRISFSTVNRYENGKHFSTPIVLECVSKFILTEIMQVIYECRQGKQSPGTCVPACRSEWRRDETL